MNRFYLLALFYVSFLNAISQPDAQIEAYFQSVRQGKTVPPPFSLNDSNISDRLVSFLNDSSDAVRSRDIQLLKDIVVNSKQPTVRQKIVFHLVLQLRKNDQQRVNVLSALRKFGKSDYDSHTLDSLLKFAERKYTHTEEVVRLIGFVGNREAIENIRKFSTPENGKSLRWSALLAMSRLGDEESTTSVLQRAKKLKINDEVVTQLFPDLIYTRQKQVIDYAVEVLMSNEASCESADNDNPTSILCGYRIMEQLALAIKNYPLTLDASGDVRTSDYKKSLATVREWFRQSKGNYSIDNTTF